MFSFDPPCCNTVNMVWENPSLYNCPSHNTENISNLAITAQTLHIYVNRMPYSIISEHTSNHALLALKMKLYAYFWCQRETLLSVKWWFNLYSDYVLLCIIKATWQWDLPFKKKHTYFIQGKVGKFFCLFQAIWWQVKCIPPPRHTTLWHIIHVTPPAQTSTVCHLSLINMPVWWYQTSKFVTCWTSIDQNETCITTFIMKMNTESNGMADKTCEQINFGQSKNASMLKQVVKKKRL